MAKKKIITGITATGDLTLGNYIGSIKQIKDIQEENLQDEIFVFVADLHALTTNNISPTELKERVENVVKLYLASGLNPRKIMIFKQSEIIGHTELFYYLITNSNIGQLERMTQFKDKTVKMDNKTSSIPAGLLLYPILMVADIMLYNANYVPIGKDQKQHLELTRDMIEKINKKYKLNFNIPEPIFLDENKAKIMGLKTPTKKMSKSDNNKNNSIFLIDEDEVIKNKIINSLTDSENKVYFDIKNKPGVSNLLTIYSALKNITIEEAEEKLKKYDYKKFKEKVALAIIDVVRPIREKFKLLNKKDIEDALEINREKVQKIANQNLNLIENAIGIKNDK